MLNRLKHLDNLDIFLVSSAIVTGVIHAYLGLIHFLQVQNISFLGLAGLGFLAGAGIFLLEKYQNALVAASIPYTGVQFVFYYQAYGFGFNLLSLIDKAVQAVFILAGIYFLKENYYSSQSVKEFLGQR